MYVIATNVPYMPGRPKREDPAERANLKLNSAIRKLLKTKALLNSRNESAQVERLILESEGWERFLKKHPELTTELNADILTVILEVKGDDSEVVKMINPSDINLNSFPWLPLEEKTAFPKRPAIYFAIDSLGHVQYIGRTVNVRNRWGSHHRYDELNAIGNIRIAYLFVDMPELLPEIESALIQYFEPNLNRSIVYITKADNDQSLVNKSVKLRALRENHPNKPTQKYLGELLGIAEGNYRRLENGNSKSISFDALDKLCKFFNCTPNDILEYPNN